jgi:hypothetical protein
MARLKSLALAIITSTPARVLGAFVAVAAAAQGVQWAVAPLRWKQGEAFSGSALAAHVVGAVLIAGVVLGVYAVFVRLTERRWPGEIAPRPGPREFAAGAGAGAALSAVSVALLWAAGLYAAGEVAPRSAWGEILTRGAVDASVVAVLEEVLFRAVLFRLVQRRLGSLWAVAVSSLLFGAAHAFNANATVGSSLAIAVEAGVLLSAVYILTQRLWVAVGLHAAWNFMQQAVVGGALSGGKVHSILEGRLGSPPWLSGGSFGIEASPIAAAVCTAAGVAVLVIATERGRLVARSWPSRAMPGAH